MDTIRHTSNDKTVQLCCFLKATVGMTLLAVAANLLPSHGVAAPVQATQLTDADQRNHKFQEAQALYLSGRLKEASVAFEELSRAYPRDAHIWLKYGNTLTKAGNYDGAAIAFLTASSIDPLQGAAQLNLALVRLAQAQGSLDAALGSLAAASTEHAQADVLQRQIRALLGPQS